MHGFRTIRARMIIVILPIIILAIIFLTYSSGNFSRQIIEKLTGQQMKSELDSGIKELSQRFETVDGIGSTVACTISSSYYKYTTLIEYEAMLGKIISNNDMVIGGGIWFEPFEYNSTKEYTAPYVYKGDKDTVTVKEYTDLEYDYFSAEWYQAVKASTEEAIYTDVYNNETLGENIATYAIPMFNGAGKFIGAVSLDIKLSAIEEVISSIQVGERGKAFLINKEGIYLSCEDNSKVMSVNITEDTNNSLAKVGQNILSKKNGKDSYNKAGNLYNIYYDTLDKQGWTLGIEIPYSEVAKPVVTLIQQLAIIGVISVVLCALAVLGIVAYLSGNLGKVKNFARNLSKGDFTVDKLTIKTKDELGQMSDSLNEMYTNNKDIIKTISNHASAINTSSTDLSNASKELSCQFGNIVEIMQQVNEDMMSTSATTEEVNASTQEVNASVNILAAETIKSMNLAGEIKKRAMHIEETSEQSYLQTKNVTAVYEKNLQESIDNAKIVNSISVLAEVISGIAEQINLLSLNASIEAARAGVQGKGFAVVADEIGKLAAETSSAVNRIKGTISQIQSAFGNLTDNSKSLLNFVTDTISPEYNNFMNVAKQYGEDAEELKKFAGQISNMSNSIETIINEVTKSIQNISESSQSTAENSNHILQCVNAVSSVVEQVAHMSTEQENISGELYSVVNRFKL